MTVSPEVTANTEALGTPETDKIVNTEEQEPVTDIDALRAEIDVLDAVILEAVQRRAEASQLLKKARMDDGGTKIVHSDELGLIGKYGEALGTEGRSLGMIMLKITRGRLGR